MLNAFKVGDDPDGWDILVVDEAHRLTQYAAQSAGPLNGRYKKISKKLFGEPLDRSKNQLDWIRCKAKHTILLLDTAQSVRPADIEIEVFDRTVQKAKTESRWVQLMSQMRVAGGNDYIHFIRTLLSDAPPAAVPDFGEYDFRIYTDLSKMLEAMREREKEVELARIVAGYAWDWRSRKDPSAIDIRIDDVDLRWNGTNMDWINSPDAAEEVGSIHTVQGYDLNYTGVIIGGDLIRDPLTGRLRADREEYRDPLGKVSNNLREQTTTDDDLLQYIKNVYSVLMTRGMRGTYVYAVDPAVLAGLTTH
ncbi:MAG: DNA/RNA helicase domain-containing protein [Brachybacterium sp.]